MSKKLKSLSGSNAPTCSPSSDTPETSEAWDAVSRTPDGMYDSQVPISAYAYAMLDHSKKMERQLDIAISALKSLASQSGHKSAPGCNCMDCQYIRPIEYAIRDASFPENVQGHAIRPGAIADNTKNDL